MEQENIQMVLNYIEEHLKDDRQGVLDNSSLATISGYSEFHFLRAFRKTIHLTPADYIRKRRISEIVRQIGAENRPMSEIAFEYGFNSKENFTRAFKKEHHISPTEFKTANCSLRLFHPFDFNLTDPCPEVSMQYLERFNLVAYPFDDGFAPNCWNQYNAEKRSIRLSGGAVVPDYGAMEWNFEKNKLDYFIGISANDANGDTSGTVHLEIAGGLYAVFDTPAATQHDFVINIRRTWDWIYGTWLPNSGYRRAKGFEFERYLETSREYSERIYVPLEKE